MDNIVNFNKYKEDKEKEQILEDNFLKFLTYVNKYVGIPTTFKKASEVIYYNLRYLEGTINCISMLQLFTKTNREEIEQFKKLTISWLESIIDSIKMI